MKIEEAMAGLQVEPVTGFVHWQVSRDSRENCFLAGSKLAKSIHAPSPSDFPQINTVRPSVTIY